MVCTLLSSAASIPPRSPAFCDAPVAFLSVTFPNLDFAIAPVEVFVKSCAAPGWRALPLHSKSHEEIYTVPGREHVTPVTASITLLQMM